MFPIYSAKIVNLSLVRRPEGNKKMELGGNILTISGHFGASSATWRYNILHNSPGYCWRIESIYARCA
jgi:hypothetical protein